MEEPPIRQNKNNKVVSQCEWSRTNSRLRDSLRKEGFVFYICNVRLTLFHHRTDFFSLSESMTQELAMISGSLSIFHNKNCLAGKVLDFQNLMTLNHLPDLRFMGSALLDIEDRHSGIQFLFGLKLVNSLKSWL